MDTIETERLTLRQFKDADTSVLYEIMRKPEVMYAWGHGFTFEETQKWLVRQQTHYQQNGLGYMAVMLKDNGTLIGQAGLLDNEIEGQPITEIGYIFDNTVWGKGYATEAAKTLVQVAFDTLGIDKLYCTMRLKNLPSVKVAERLGFQLKGEYTKVYNGIIMPHLIYEFERRGRTFFLPVSEK
ncbi:MAG: GNAT family N-acetyltransferase [Eubacteriales bacterium]